MAGNGGGLNGSTIPLFEGTEKNKETLQRGQVVFGPRFELEI